MILISITSDSSCHTASQEPGNSVYPGSYRSLKMKRPIGSIPGSANDSKKKYMKYSKNLIYTILIFVVFTGCNNGPKVISAKTPEDTATAPSGIFSDENTFNGSSPNQGNSFTDDLHKVVVNEVLPAERYVYLNVTEAGEQFWIAARKQQVEVGATYFYREGLLKTNFESKEYNRVFDRIFLVSNLVPENHGDGSATLNSDVATSNSQFAQKAPIETHTEKIVQHKGSIKIAELVANPKDYEGKTVQITGKCVKINPNIMERNWIHLQDGSKDDFDLVVTSATFVPEGKVVTVKALVSLNRDFGAGYKYNIILENGVVIE
jgi:hypothetical protein